MHQMVTGEKIRHSKIPRGLLYLIALLVTVGLARSYPSPTASPLALPAEKENSSPRDSQTPYEILEKETQATARRRLPLFHRAATTADAKPIVPQPERVLRSDRTKALAALTFDALTYDYFHRHNGLGRSLLN